MGHLTWQGIPQPNNRNAGLTATLTLCVGGTPANYVVTTDASGFFTLTTGLQDGPYNFRIKGVRSLANAGTLSLAGSSTQVEFGTERAGDCNNSNIVNSQDFSILRIAFGGFDPRADFNNDGVVNSQDFTLLKNNFGALGASLTCP